MAKPDDQVAELIEVFGEVHAAPEGGVTCLIISNVDLPPGCTPEKVDVLLWPEPRDGYPSRLFVSHRITHGGQGTNWNVAGVRILERTWFGVSWKVQAGLRLAQQVRAHLDAFRKK